MLIPSANTRQLMLRRDVIEAVSAGLFHVYAIDTADQGLEILTGLSAGARGADGTFADGSVNQRVERRLVALAEQARAFRAPGKAQGEPGASGTTVSRPSVSG